ncbi:hypothetical protein PTKIN_Ptkin07bG0259600 [Pterospermum kingtungense]
MESKQQSGTQGNRFQCSLQVSITNIYFTNFPDGWKAENLWEIFKNYRDIDDVFIPAKRNIRGQRFGIICYRNMNDVEGLIDSLNKIWIGSYKLRFYIARSSLGINYSKNFYGSVETKGKNSVVKPTGKNSYADVVKGGLKTRDESTTVSISVGKEKIPIDLNVDGSSVSLDHVQVSLENGILSIKIDLGKMLKVLGSDSSKDTISSPRCETYRESPKVDVSHVNHYKDVGVSAIIPHTVHLDHSLIEETSSVGYDQRNSHENEENSESKLGSPCFSVHNIGTDGISFGHDGVDPNFREVDDVVRKNEEYVQPNLNNNEDLDSRAIVIVDDLTLMEPLEVNANDEREKEEEQLS